MSLPHDTLRRYARHLVLPDFGEAAQRRLLDARVLCIGAGGLGAASLSYLCAAGVGTLGIVDDDKVELSNLGRQIIHETGDIGRNKVDSASDRLSELNPDCTVQTYATAFTTENALALVTDYDLIVDGSDNYRTRYALNDACLKLKKPWVYAAVRGWQAQLSSFAPNLSPAPCYRCLVPEEPSTVNDCAEGGVISPLVGIAGSMQALEAIKILSSLGEPLYGRLLRFDALHSTWRSSKLTAEPKCICQT